ncbi:MAG: GNAT family N-acetyltransferase [Kiloniellales bacterium]
MTVRNLDSLFKPRSVALVGASKRAGSVGAVVARNLFHAGFEGPILPLNPTQAAIEGVLTYNSVAALPLAPDLAVIATPPDTVPGLIAELAERGTRGAVVITAGFGEGGSEAGEARRSAMLQAARPHLLRVVGPNCLGIMVPGVGLNASFSHVAPLPGDLAFLTQSGALVTAMLDWATPRGIGFSQIVSLGDMSDVDFGDMLDYLARDSGTRAILLYVEAVTHARKFMSAARAAARTKPVIVIKGGRHAEGAKAAASHTGALAGSDAVYDAAFARAGMLRVFTLDELFDAAETLAALGARAARTTSGDRLAILTNGGGAGVLATDALIESGGRLAALSPETLKALDAALPVTWSRGNPVDIIGDAQGDRYAAALEALLGERAADAILVINCPTAVASSSDAARAVVDALAKHEPRPVFTNWLGSEAAREARALFAQERIPTYETPEQAVRAFLHLARYRRNQDLLTETPPSLPGHFTPDTAAARRVIATALAEDRAWLGEPEAKRVLAAYGIPVLAAETAADPAEAAAKAKAIGGPVALKILSPDITHKSDLGGVTLDLAGAETVRAAAEAMQARVGKAAPGARLEGFIVEAMCRRRGAEELILGIVEDAQFGPVVLFGHGGTAVEVIRDKALALPPLNLNLAHALMAQTRVHRLLQGYRDRPAADLEAIALTLIKLAQLAADIAEIVEVDINPLLADAEGVIALDARIKVHGVVPPLVANPAARLAIRPYPKSLEQQATLPDGQAVFLRPIRPEDAPALRAAFRALKPEDVRLRFFSAMSEMSEAQAKRLSQIDYDREMALVALDPDDESDGWGIARLIADPDNLRGEFAIVVRSDRQGHGLGQLLMERLIAYARSRGTGEIWGDVLAENQRMLALAKELGMTVTPLPDDPSVVRVSLSLAKPDQRTAKS